MTSRLRAYSFLAAGALIWAFGGIVIKVTLNELTPAVFLVYRFFISSIIVFPIIFIKRMHLPKRVSFLNLFLVGFFGTTINIGLLFYGTKLTTVNNLAVIGAVAPIMAITAGAIILKEHITNQEKLGIGVTIIGVLILIIMPIVETHGDGYSNLTGNILIMLSNFGWVGFVIFSKKVLRQKVDPFLITATGFIVGFFTLIPFAIAEAGSVPNIINIISNVTPSTHLGVFYMAIFSGVIAYFLYQLGQKTIEVSEAALFSYLQSVFTIVLAFVILGEQMSTFFVIGALIVVAGVVIAETKRRML